MEVSSLISANSANPSVSTNVIKKAENVQEQQMQGVLQGLEQSNPTNKINTQASQYTGVGATLNTLA